MQRQYEYRPNSAAVGLLQELDCRRAHLKGRVDACKRNIKAIKLRRAQALALYVRLVTDDICTLELGSDPALADIVCSRDSQTCKIANVQHCMRVQSRLIDELKCEHATYRDLLSAADAEQHQICAENTISLADFPTEVIAHIAQYCGVGARGACRAFRQFTPLNYVKLTHEVVAEIISHSRLPKYTQPIVIIDVVAAHGVQYTIKKISAGRQINLVAVHNHKTEPIPIYPATITCSRIPEYVNLRDITQISFASPKVLRQLCRRSVPKSLHLTYIGRCIMSENRPPEMIFSDVNVNTITLAQMINSSIFADQITVRDLTPAIYAALCCTAELCNYMSHYTVLTGRTTMQLHVPPGLYMPGWAELVFIKN